MTAPFHKLKHEHRIIEQALRALNGISLRLQVGEPIPSNALSRVVDFIKTFTDHFHHRKEEEHLFPALERQGIQREDGPLGMMEHEHEIERQLLDELDIAIKAYQRGDDEAGRRFAEAATRYTDHLISHVQKEDNVLFKIAEEMMGEEEQKDLMDAFKKAEAEMGEGVLEHYERMAAELEEEWTV
ncbi:MAG: hemerythrin domain-containing protein [Blastocatellia bacterium]|nr:hemerythrin domain-containing protein [Blastocatellia bacterium]